jgi:hypothetical protein
VDSSQERFEIEPAERFDSLNKRRQHAMSFTKIREELRNGSL